MTSKFHHNLILMRETCPQNLVKIRHDDVMLRHMTSFSYIFPYYDVISKNTDKFGAPGPKNAKMKKAGLLGTPPPCTTASKKPV